MAKTQSATTLVSSASMAAGAAAVYGSLNCENVDGGIVTFKITNDALLTTQGTAKVYIAHKGTSIPSVGAESSAATGWKQVYEIGGGLTAAAVTRGTYRFGPEVAYLQISFSGNAGNSMTVEAFATTYTY